MSNKSSCWAAALGDCQGRISQEHYISRAMWDTDVIDVIGFSWCKDEPKQVPVARLTAGVLCEHHNQTLSEVDAAGAFIFQTFKKAEKLWEERSKSPHVEWAKSLFNINGWMLERWLAKAMMGILRAGFRQQEDRQEEHTINALVRCAFGLEKLKEPHGLYMPAEIGDDVDLIDGFRFAPMYSREETLVGGMFFFRGYRMLLSLTDVSPLGGVEVPMSFSNVKLVQRQSLYRPQQYRYGIGSRISHRIRFRWESVEPRRR